MNAIGFLALIYVVVCTLMWAGLNLHDQRLGRSGPTWLRWLFVYLWPLVPAYHWYNLALIAYRRRRVRITWERVFGKAYTKKILAMLDEVVRRP